VKPVVALVGRPNVGKSTLFNRLTGSRAALVSDFPGLTRDRQYGSGRLGGRPYIVVDTGGLSGEREGIDVLMESQAMRAVMEADIVLFLVDGRAGLTGADQTVLEQLRATGRPIVLVINKTEGQQPAIAFSEFAVFGAADAYCVSAAHGDGVATMMAEVLARFAPEEGEEESADAEVDGRASASRWSDVRMSASPRSPTAYSAKSACSPSTCRAPPETASSFPSKGTENAIL